MTRHDMRGFAIVATTLMLFVAFIWGICWLDDRQPKDCYADFAATYTWQHRLPEMKEMWADKRLTIGECSKVDEIYSEAKVESQARETQEKIDALGNI